MEKLNVKHYLDIYRFRQKMQEDGVLNWSEEMRKFTSELIDKLSQLSLDEEIILDNGCFLDSKRNLVIKFPLSLPPGFSPH